MRRVRAARSDDLPRLQEIEVAAGALFADVGLPSVADDEPPSIPVLTRYQVGGRAWVSTDDADRPVGYALALEVDGSGHLEQLSVDPAAGRQGRGAELVEVVVAWAAGRGFPALTLSTFLDVPWNAPYYERLGFRVLTEEEVTPGLLVLRQHELDAGLDVSRRGFMRREIEGADQTASPEPARRCRG